MLDLVPYLANIRCKESSSNSRTSSRDLKKHAVVHNGARELVLNVPEQAGVGSARSRGSRQ